MPEPDVGMTPASDEAESGLRRTVGPLGASLSGIGIVLGAGIYVLVGEASGEAGNAVWAAFLLAAFLAAATGLSYAELTAMIPESGAAAAYADEAFGSRAAFVTGWMDVIVNIVAVPAVALGLRKMNQCVEHEATPQILGMGRPVGHLIKVEELNA